MICKKSRISMVIPNRGRAGGIRSTVVLSNGLLKRGHQVRLLVRRPRPGSRAWLNERKHGLLVRVQRLGHHDWVDSFTGPVQHFTKLPSIEFEDGEIVVAVGSRTIQDVHELSAPVRKLRHCRGFSQHNASEMDVWKIPMKTIAVSSTLTPLLEELAPGTVLGVVPNGKEQDLYYDERIDRRAIGTIYYKHPNKCPEHTIALLGAIRERWSSVPQLVFSTEEQPRELEHVEYYRYPSVDLARQLYCRSKVWLLTSRDEGMPGPVLEAMLCGAVVVSADNFGSRELIDDQRTGFIVAVGDTEAFMDRIDLMLSDEAKRSQITDAAKLEARKYSWQRAVDRMEEALKRL